MDKQTRTVLPDVEPSGIDERWGLSDAARRAAPPPPNGRRGGTSPGEDADFAARLAEAGEAACPPDVEVDLFAAADEALGKLGVPLGPKKVEVPLGVRFIGLTPAVFSLSIETDLSLRFLGGCEGLETLLRSGGIEHSARGAVDRWAGSFQVVRASNGSLSLSSSFGGDLGTAVAKTGSGGTLTYSFPLHKVSTRIDPWELSGSAVFKLKVHSRPEEPTEEPGGFAVPEPPDTVPLAAALAVLGAVLAAAATAATAPVAALLLPLGVVTQPAATERPPET